MHGENAVSETELCRQNIERLSAGAIVIGDAGFGIFGVADQVKRFDHDFFLRAKKFNFESLRKHVTLTPQGDNCKTCNLQWIPTKKNRATQPQ